MNASQFIERIQAAGFTLEVEESGIAVSPASKLTDQHRQFIRQHRPEILAALTRAPAPGPDATQLRNVAQLDSADPAPAPDATEADLAHGEYVRDRICSGWTWHLGQWLPPDAQKPAQGAQQAEQLPMPRLEPNRALQGATFAGIGVRCADCRHAVSTDHPALIDCGAGREPAAACGSWWSLDVRTCGSFEAKGARAGGEA